MIAASWLASKGPMRSLSHRRSPRPNRWGERPFVGLVSPIPPRLGGVATVAGWLLRHEREIGCRYIPFDLTRADEEMGGRFRISAFAYQIGLTARFIRWIREAPTSIHYMSSASLTGLMRDMVFLGLLAARRHRVIAHIHIVRPDVWWWRYILRAIDRLVIEIIVLGKPAEQALSKVGVTSRVIPNGVPFDFSIIEPRARIVNGSQDTFRLLFVGTYGERKGCAELIEALGLLSDLDCELYIVGQEEFRGEKLELLHSVETYGVAKRVHFLGTRKPEDLPLLYTSSHALCLPSREEGLPLALIEAMAHGLPVLTTSVGCISDLVIHDQTGIIVEVGDATSLAEGISRLAHDSELCYKLGRSGAQHVSRYLKPDLIARQWHTVYSDLARYDNSGHLAALPSSSP